jgi:hypothetical protein
LSRGSTVLIVYCYFFESSPHETTFSFFRD